MDPQFVRIEDDLELGQAFIEHLNISHLVNQVAYITDIQFLKSFISQPNRKRIFWVDINLGIGRENDGYEMIKVIRSDTTDSLIIVFSLCRCWQEMHSFGS